MNIVITGASKGIGKAIAEKYAAENEHTLLLCSRNEMVLRSVAKDLQQKYPQTKILLYACDVSKKNEVSLLAHWVLDQVSQVDILINNAGSFIPGSVYNEPDDALENMLQVNLLSAYYLTRLLLPSMMERKSGHIFNMCSIASLQAYPNGGAYSISKFALDGFSKNLREELKPYYIKVTSVYPGAVYTDSWAGSGVDPKRIMEAGDIANMVYAVSKLSPQACVEDIVLRPQLGDL